MVMKERDRNKDIEDVAHVISKLYKVYKLDKKVGMAQIQQNWTDIVGPVIAQRTEKLFIKEGVLYIKVSSAPLKNELLLSKEQLKKKVEEYFTDLQLKGITIL